MYIFIYYDFIKCINFNIQVLPEIIVHMWTLTYIGLKHLLGVEPSKCPKFWDLLVPLLLIGFQTKLELYPSDVWGSFGHTSFSLALQTFTLYRSEDLLV